VSARPPSREACKPSAAIPRRRRASVSGGRAGRTRRPGARRRNAGAKACASVSRSTRASSGTARMQQQRHEARHLPHRLRLPPHDQYHTGSTRLLASPLPDRFLICATGLQGPAHGQRPLCRRGWTTANIGDGGSGRRHRVEPGRMPSMWDAAASGAGGSTHRGSSHVCGTSAEPRLWPCYSLPLTLRGGNFGGRPESPLTELRLRRAHRRVCRDWVTPSDAAWAAPRLWGR
jgi:hypothetical protein